MSGDADIVEVASRWRVRLQEMEPESPEARDLETWLSHDPRHRAAFEATGRLWDVFDAAGDPLLEGARRRALAHARPARRAVWTRRGVRTGIGLALAAGLAALAFLGPPASSRVYSTGERQRERVRLQDGSAVTLDQSTRLEVAYSRGRRNLKLLAGQARFDVAHDASRPFVVAAGSKLIVATGTAFNVDNGPRRLVVSLYDGRVQIANRPRNMVEGLVGAAAQDQVELQPGQALTVDQGRASIALFEAQVADAWENGRLVFDDAPLADAIERVNRYLDRRILIADNRIARFRISGVFNTGEAEGFIEGVSALAPVDARVDAGGDIRLTLRAPAPPPGRAR